MGYYAINGILQPCPAGHFGSMMGLNSDKCSGECDPGWYCPESSTSARQVACGSEDQFCPSGSASPKKVQLGYYTSKEEEPCPPGSFRMNMPNFDVPLSPIATSQVDGTCVLCQQGYKHISGDDPTLCVSCGSKARSTAAKTTCECYQSSTEKIIFQLKFDPVKANCYRPSDFQVPDDFHNPDTQMTKQEEIPCEKGYYCDRGKHVKPCLVM